MITDALRLVRVLFSPGDVFREIKERPPFWVPFFLVAIVFAVTQMLASPFQMKVREIMVTQAGQPAPPAASGTVAMIGTLVVTPIMVLLMSAIAAGILYVLMQMLGGEDATFKRMLSVVIHAWPATLILQALTVGVLYMRGLDSIRTTSDAQVSLGLDLLLPAEMAVGAFTRAVLAGIGPLQIWGLVITAVGLEVLGGAEKGKAWTGAIISFVIGLLIAGGLAGAFSGMMGG